MRAFSRCEAVFFFSFLFPLSLFQKSLLCDKAENVFVGFVAAESERQNFRYCECFWCVAFTKTSGVHAGRRWLGGRSGSPSVFFFRFFFFFFSGVGRSRRSILIKTSTPKQAEASCRGFEITLRSVFLFCCSSVKPCERTCSNRCVQTDRTAVSDPRSHLKKKTKRQNKKQTNTHTHTHTHTANKFRSWLKSDMF